VLFVFSVQQTLTTLLFFAKNEHPNGLTGQRAAIGETSRTVKLPNCFRFCLSFCRNPCRDDTAVKSPTLCL
jgi:hypothetical protein